MLRAILVRSTALLASVLALSACKGRGDGEARARALAAKERQAQAAFDFGRPLAALDMSAGDAAERGGSFAWEAAVDWTVSRPGSPALHAAERHRVRQLASGAFSASAEIDPGSGPGSTAGRDVVFASGMTYARAQWAPFRERPSDGGRDARRFRDESFRAGGAVAELLGPALRASPAGEATVLGRPARRYALSFAGGAAPQPAPAAPEGLPKGGYDDDTRRHLAFLDGRVPSAARGELVLDAKSGAPLALELEASFTERDDPQVRADVRIAAHVTALGGAVAAVEPPRGALPDERKPKGVARALEAAGLKKRAGEATSTDAADEGEGEADEPAQR
jgi:hypothetical protein